MATYVPVATQTTEPTSSQTVESAALEFRTLKTRVNALEVDLDAVDVSLDTRLDLVEATLLSTGLGGTPGVVYIERFSGDGVSLTLALSVTPVVVNVVDVYIGGVYQNHDTFSVAGTTLTFTEAPVLGTNNIEVRISVPLSTGTTADASAVNYFPAGTGAVATTVQDELRKTVFLSDFGAVGDGTTDDYAAIMLAHNSLPTSGGVIHAGRKQYLFGTPIVFTKPITLIGEGSSIVSGVIGPTEFIKKSTVAGTGIALQADGCVLEKFNVRGQVGNTGDGVAIQAGRVCLRDITVYTMGQDGIRLGGAAAENCNGWRLDNVRSKENLRHGILLSDPAAAAGLGNVNGGLLTGADLQVNGSCGLLSSNTQLNTFVGVLSQTNGVGGVWLDDEASQNTFIGGDYEGNPTDFYTAALARYNRQIGGVMPGVVTDLGIRTTFTNVHMDATVGLGNGGLVLPNTDINSGRVLDWYEEVDHSAEVLLTSITAATAGAFTVGAVYKIVTVGTTDFTLIGAASNTVGVVFTATGVGAGTGTALGGGTYTTRKCYYTRIGDTVNIQIYLTWTGHTGTAGQQMFVHGLPFANNGTGNMLSLLLDGVTYGAGIPVVFIGALDTKVGLYLQTSGAALAGIVLDTAGTLVINGSYRTLT